MSEDLQHNEILARYLNREISEDQLLQESEGLEEFVKLAKLADNLEVPAEKTASQAWERLSENISKEEKEVAPVKPLWSNTTKIFSRVAAVGLILVMSYFVWPKETRISTRLDQQEEVNLPDGSTVSLFSTTSLSYKKGKWDKSRELELDGEAFFEVTEGNSFVVHTELGEVEVLGTSFNVFQRDDEFEVLCFTGKVKVQTGEKSVLLLPGEKSILTKDALVKAEMEPGLEQPAWQSGKINIENASVSDLADLIERYYGYKVTYEKGIESKVSGVFLTQDLENALKVICDPIELNYIFEGNRAIHLSR